MRRATETAEAVGAALGLEPEPVPYAFEFHRGETFAEAMGRVRMLKARFEAEAEAAPRTTCRCSSPTASSPASSCSTR